MFLLITCLFFSCPLLIVISRYLRVFCCHGDNCQIHTGIELSPSQQTQSVEKHNQTLVGNFCTLSEDVFLSNP